MPVQCLLLAGSHDLLDHIVISLPGIVSLLSAGNHDD